MLLEKSIYDIGHIVLSIVESVQNTKAFFKISYDKNDTYKYSIKIDNLCLTENQVTQLIDKNDKIISFLSYLAHKNKPDIDSEISITHVHNKKKYDWSVTQFVKDNSIDKQCTLISDTDEHDYLEISMRINDVSDVYLSIAITDLYIKLQDVNTQITFICENIRYDLADADTINDVYEYIQLDYTSKPMLTRDKLGLFSAYDMMHVIESKTITISNSEIKFITHDGEIIEYKNRSSYKHEYYMRHYCKNEFLYLLNYSHINNNKKLIYDVYNKINYGALFIKHNHRLYMYNIEDICEKTAYDNRINTCCYEFDVDPSTLATEILRNLIRELYTTYVNKINDIVADKENDMLVNHVDELKSILILPNMSYVELGVEYNTWQSATKRLTNCGYIPTDYDSKLSRCGMHYRPDERKFDLIDIEIYFDQAFFNGVAVLAPGAVRASKSDSYKYDINNYLSTQINNVIFINDVRIKYDIKMLQNKYSKSFFFMLNKKNIVDLKFHRLAYNIFKNINMISDKVMWLEPSDIADCRRINKSKMTTDQKIKAIRLSAWTMVNGSAKHIGNKNDLDKYMQTNNDVVFDVIVRTKKHEITRDWGKLSENIYNKDMYNVKETINRMLNISAHIKSSIASIYAKINNKNMVLLILENVDDIELVPLMYSQTSCSNEKMMLENIIDNLKKHDLLKMVFDKYVIEYYLQCTISSNITSKLMKTSFRNHEEILDILVSLSYTPYRRRSESGSVVVVESIAEKADQINLSLNSTCARLINDMKLVDFLSNSNFFSYNDHKILDHYDTLYSELFENKMDTTMKCLYNSWRNENDNI